MKTNQNKHTPKYLFGAAKFFSTKDGYGYVVVPGVQYELRITNQNGPFQMGAGVDTPFISNDKFGLLPRNGDKLVLEVEEQRGRLQVVAWGAERSWRNAEKAIAQRPKYMVCIENRFNGQMMTSQAGRDAVIGTVEQLVAQSPRDGYIESTVDKFAPYYRPIPKILAMNKFMRQVDGKWVPCEDPRPFPIATEYRLVYQTGKDDQQLAVGTALQINQQFPRNFGVDPLIAFVEQGVPGGHLVWYKYNPDIAKTAPKESPWSECADPRPLPVKEQAESTVTAQTTATATTASSKAKPNGKNKPSVMPKKEKRADGFSRGVMTDFAALETLKLS